jgi:hypothetical protein
VLLLWLFCCSLISHYLIGNKLSEDLEPRTRPSVTSPAFILTVSAPRSTSSNEERNCITNDAGADARDQSHLSHIHTLFMFTIVLLIIPTVVFCSRCVTGEASALTAPRVFLCPQDKPSRETRRNAGRRTTDDLHVEVGTPPWRVGKPSKDRPSSGWSMSAWYRVTKSGPEEPSTARATRARPLSHSLAVRLQQARNL